MSLWDSALHTDGLHRDWAAGLDAAWTAERYSMRIHIRRARSRRDVLGGATKPLAREQPNGHPICLRNAWPAPVGVRSTWSASGACRAIAGTGNLPVHGCRFSAVSIHLIDSIPIARHQLSDCQPEGSMRSIQWMRNSHASIVHPTTTFGDAAPERDAFQ